MSKQKVILVTGASSGLGKALASLSAKQGYRVFGTSRQPERTKPAGYAMLQLDVRSDESVDRCVQTLVEQAGSLDVLVNNAGYELAGALEEASIDEAKEQFETNFFGVVRMVKAVLPVMRQQRSGHIINIGSLAGLIGVPFHGFYSASKHALEGYSEALRHEVRNFGTRVSIVEASFMKTNFDKSMQITVNSIDDYSRMRRSAFKVFEEAFESGKNPAIAATVVHSIIKNRTPRLRYRVGNIARRIPRLKALLPQAIFEAGMRRNLKLNNRP